MNKKKKIYSGFISLILLLGIITPLINTTEFVIAQSGYIDVYVYDAITYSPISGANVLLLDDMYSYITDDFTDGSGHVNFTSLDVGTYNIEVYAAGYKYNDTSVTIDFEGEGELVQFYQELTYTPGNSYIEASVYDSDTLSPIPNAYIILRNEFGEYITEGTADGSGFYNFTGLGIGIYEVYATNQSYNEGWVIVNIFTDGDAYIETIYLNPAYVPGIGFIDVYVYDDNTLTPIQNADVALTDEYGAHIDWGMTDSSGFYNFTGLGEGDYNVSASHMDYITNSSAIYIDYDGEGEYLMLYLAPFIRTLEILTPSDSETIDGSMVFVSYTASEISELTTLDVYVNAELITTNNVYGNLRDFFVPIFENGTNTIYLEANYMDGSSANDSVDINSVNVIPRVEIKEGDWLNYIQEDLVNLYTYEANFTFVTWLSTFEILTSYSSHVYNETHTIEDEVFWLTVNVLNGYVSADDSATFLYQHFFPFACLPPNPIVGDISVYIPWADFMTVNGSTTWKFSEMWTLEAYGGMVGFYAEKSTNIIHLLSMPGMMTAELVNSSIDFTNPYITDIADFDYDEGDTGNTITWTVTDRFPGLYQITRDGAYVDNGHWNSLTPIWINVDGLAAGEYDYLIVITDCAGNTAQDTVTVTVNPLVPEFESQYFVFLPILVLTTYLIINKRRKKNK